jgi:antitoxin CptB
MSHLRSTSESLPDDNRVIRRRRLLFRCWHRGTQESDLILGQFAETSLKSMDSAQLDRFEALLDCPDPDLFDRILGRSAPPPEHDHAMMRLLRSSCAVRHAGQRRTHGIKPED